MELFNSIEATSRRSRIIDGKIANEVSVAASRWEKNKKKFDIFKQKTKSFFMNASITFQTIPDYDKPTNYSLNRSIGDVAKVTDELDSRLSEREIGFFDRSKIITNILRAFSNVNFSETDIIVLADQPFKILNKHFDKITNLFLDGAVLKTEQLNYVAQYIGNIIKNGISDEKLADLFNGLSEDREKAIKFLTTVSQNLDVIKSMGDDFQKTGEIISKYIDLNINLNQTIANAKSNGLDNQNIANIISSLYELNMDNENNIADSLNMVELVLPAASSLINSGEVGTYSLCEFISKATNRSFSRNNIKNIIFTAISGEYHNGIALFNSINSNIDSIYALVEQQNIEVDSIFRLLSNLSERGLDDNAIKNVLSSIANEYKDNANGIINSLNDNISSIARNDNIADVIKSFNILLNYGLDKKQISDIVEFRKDEIRDNMLIISSYPHKLSNTFSIPNAMFGLENKIDDIKVNEMNVSFGIGTLKNTHGLSAPVVPTIVFSGSPLADNQKIEVKLGHEMNPIDFATSVKNIGFEETLYLPQYRDLLYRNGSDRISLVTKDSNGVDVVDSNLIGKFRLTNNPTLNMVFNNLSLSNNKSLSRQ